MTKSPLSGRPSDRKGLLVRQLRSQILEGKLLPGEQLPTRSELEQHFAASPGTVQSALDQLRHDGFTVVRGRQGTFVNSSPPHLTNYALVFPSQPEDGLRQWVRFWTALANEAGALQRVQGARITAYYAVDQHHDSEDFLRLQAEVESHRLAGIIFASPAFLIQGTRILDEPGIPRVAIAELGGDPGMPSVGPDMADFWERAFADLRARGRRRVAVLNPPQEPRVIESIRAAAAVHDLEIPDHWMQGVHVNAPELASNLVRLLFHGAQGGTGSCPDALIISDDNLVEAATAGLKASGLHVPEDVDVVAHCNFPWPPSTSGLDVRWLGFDARAVLRNCLEILGEMRQKGSAVDSVPVPAIFGHELVDSRTPPRGL